MIAGHCIRLRGQGAGGRRFVWQLPTRIGQSGDVLADVEGMLIRITAADQNGFEATFHHEAPLLAQIDAVATAPRRFAGPPQGFASPGAVVGARAQGAAP